jgi:hypothetical protein
MYSVTVLKGRSLKSAHWNQNTRCELIFTIFRGSEGNSFLNSCSFWQLLTFLDYGASLQFLYSLFYLNK